MSSNKLNKKSNLKIEYWISENEIGKMSYSRYWNDEEIEKEKGQFYCSEDKDYFSDLENYLKSSGLSQDYLRCSEYISTNLNRKIEGVGIDLAAGNLWAVPYIFKNGNIKKLFCLEYSKHRLLKCGPQLIEHYNLPNDKIVLVLGDFYDLKIADDSLDFVFLSQAFHHADNPNELLNEINRVLKSNGIVIIIGEHKVKIYTEYIAYFMKYIITKTMSEKLQHKFFKKSFYVNSLIPCFGELIEPDPILGDHYYTEKEYSLLFNRNDFIWKRVKSVNSNHLSFVLIKK